MLALCFGMLLAQRARRRPRMDASFLLRRPSVVVASRRIVSWCILGACVSVVPGLALGVWRPRSASVCARVCGSGCMWVIHGGVGVGCGCRCGEWV